MNIYQSQLMAGKIYSNLPEGKRKLAYAQGGISKMLSFCPNSYISLSFGKQSICTAHMIYQQNQTVPAFFLASDETWHMYNYQEVINKFLKICPLNLTIVQTNHFFEADSWKENRDKGDKDLQNMCNRKDWDGWFWGLAKEEGRARKLTCSKNNTDIHPTIFRYSDGKSRCTPIQDWNINDLAAYIQKYNLPMLNVYEKFGLEQRTTARITKKCRDFGSIEYLRITNSKGYRELSDSHKEITF